jgi:glycosyltransferase involved in cell wall biosynthesis
MRVLTLTPFYPTASNDAEGCFVAESVVSLAELGVAMEVVAVQPWYQPLATPRAGRWTSTRLRYLSWPGNKGLAGAGRSLHRGLSRLVQQKTEQPFHLIHAHAPLPCGHAALLLSRKLGIPFVVTVHGLDAFLTEQVKGSAGLTCMEVAREVYEDASRVICISRSVAEVVQRGACGKGKTEVVYNGVNSNLFSPGGETSATHTVLSVGNLIPIKGHDLLLRAMAEIVTACPQVKLRIIGEGPERPRLEALSRELNLAGRVEFLGRRARTEVANEMRNCTVFALPSRFEGLGCVYLEAMACGRPVIACRGQGIGDIVASGENGFLVSPDQPEELSHVLQKLLADGQLRASVGAAGRETALRDLTLEHQAALLYAIYKECVA